MILYQFVLSILLNSFSLQLLAGGAISTIQTAVKTESLETYKKFHKIARHGSDNGYDLALFLSDNAPLDLNYPTFSGDTPLMGAVKHNKLLNARLLLKNNANVDQENNELTTPLMVATMNNNLEIVSELLLYHPNLNAQNGNGKTALMLAAENDNDAIIGLLLKKGADIGLKDHQGKSAFDYARGRSKTILENYKKKLETIYRKHFQDVYQQQKVNIPTDIENIMIAYSLPENKNHDDSKKSE